MSSQSKLTKLIEVDSLYFADNVRSPECSEIPQMVESFKRNKYKVNHPVVVSEHDDKHLVLCGNRRGIALHWLRDHDAEEYRRVLPTGKIPAIVHKGLTAEEETLLRIDHSSDEDRVPLDEWSIFLAIKQLVKMGVDSQEQIAEKLQITHTKGKNVGRPNRSIVQPRVNLARLPVKVQDEIRKYTLDPDSTALRWTHISTLYKAYNREFVKHPNADGPIFLAAWEAALKPIPRKENKDPEGKRDLTAADAVKRAQAASSANLATTLLAITGQSDANLADVDKTMAEAEAAVVTLVQIKSYLGDKDYTELIAMSLEHAAIQESAIKAAKEDVAKVE